MTELILTANPKLGKGKGVNRKLRAAGLIPGVVYGQEDPVSIQFDERTAARIVSDLHGSEQLISLHLSDGEGKKPVEKQVLLKEVQTTPVGNGLIHIDFFEVNVKATVHVSVEVRPEGRGIGEKMGGVLQQVTREVAIECLPTIIPDHLRIDVNDMEIGDSLHVSDIVLPEGIVVLTSLEETVFVMAAPRVEEEVAEEELEEGEEGVIEGEEPAEEAEESTEE